MTSTQWRTSLQDQHRLYGKSLFTVGELAHLGNSSAHALSVQLRRLCVSRLIRRYAQGRYGLPDVVTPELLVEQLDSGAYITGAYALSRHNLITQRLVEVTCFTNRRHNRSRVRSTPLGRFVFICVRAPVYSPPEDQRLASPEQALCDLVFLMRRKGLDARSLFTFRGLDRLDTQMVSRILTKYPATVGEVIREDFFPR